MSALPDVAPVIARVRAIRGVGSVTLSLHEADALCEVAAHAAHLDQLLSRPYVGAWIDEVLVEAAHQVERWGAEHDAGKAPEDWFWLLGYLAGKAVAAARGGEIAKARHHTVSSAAALANWAAQLCGHESVMRPGRGPERLAAGS